MMPNSLPPISSSSQTAFIPQWSFQSAVSVNLRILGPAQTAAELCLSLHLFCVTPLGHCELCCAVSDLPMVRWISSRLWRLPQPLVPSTHLWKGCVIFYHLETPFVHSIMCHRMSKLCSLYPISCYTCWRHQPPSTCDEAVVVPILSAWDWAQSTHFLAVRALGLC